MTVDATSQPGLLGPKPSTQAVAFRSGRLCAIDATPPASRTTVSTTTLRKNARATAVDAKLPRVAGSGLASGIQMPGVAPAGTAVDTTPRRGSLGPKPSTQSTVVFRSRRHDAIDATPPFAQAEVCGRPWTTRVTGTTSYKERFKTLFDTLDLQPRQ